MIRTLLSPASLWQGTGVALVRILVGLFMIYHGLEIIDKTLMDEYTSRLVNLEFPAPAFLAYLGKAAELGSGIMLALGFLTRLGAIAMAITMCIICFGMGEGRIFMEDQHPFLFVLLGILFFFTGPGKYSIDEQIFGRKGAVGENKVAYSGK